MVAIAVPRLPMLRRGRSAAHLALPRRHVGAPVAKLRNVAVAALGERARIEDARDLATVGEPHLAAIQVWRLARFHPAPYLVRYAVDLALDRNPTLGHLEHAGVPVIDRVQPVARRGARLAEKLGPREIAVQRQAAHQRAVHEQLERHFRSRLAAIRPAPPARRGSATRAAPRQLPPATRPGSRSRP